MPEKIDPQLRARCVRLVREHAQEYPTLTAATAAVARQEGVSRESVRRWLAQAEVDDGTRPGVTSEESVEVKRLKSEAKRLREDNEILRRASFSSRQYHPEDGPAGLARFFAACGGFSPMCRPAGPALLRAGVA